MWFVRHFFNGIFLSTICIRELVKTYEGQMQFTGEEGGGGGGGGNATPCPRKYTLYCTKSDSSIL